MRLCGISSCFQLLSPGTGQITHALLTRPPLTVFPSIRKLPVTQSVRLACVKHAASVHPEPGSNSHVDSFSPASFIWHQSLDWFLSINGLYCFWVVIFFSVSPSGSASLPITVLFLWILPESVSSLLETFLGIFRVALLFICQGSVLLFVVHIFRSNSDSLSQVSDFVNNFFHIFWNYIS